VAKEHAEPGQEAPERRLAVKPPESRDQAFAEPGNQLRIRAAWIYYIEGRTQNEVASILGLPRVAVTRLLSEARRRGEVKIQITSPLAELTELQREIEAKYGLAQAVIAPYLESGSDPTPVIAAAAGRYISETMTSNLTVGVGWGRTLHASLPFIEGRPLEDIRIISLLGGIAQARRFNPAEFAWQFAELFNGEGYLVPAPALVDSPETKHALLEHCGLEHIFEMADGTDVALFSVGGISTLTTSYRLGHVTETERRSLQEAGAVGDILYNFVDTDGALVDHPVNARAISYPLDRLAKVPRKILVSGGPEKVAVLRAALKLLRPTTLITDEQTAIALM
jgi:deoxyribonucleoside regulator